MSQPYKRRNVPPVYDAAWFAAEFGNVQRSQADGPYLPLTGGTVTGAVSASAFVATGGEIAGTALDSGHALDLKTSIGTRVIEAIDGTGHTGAIGFFAATPSGRPTVTGSRGGNAALASLLTALATLGLIMDSST